MDSAKSPAQDMANTDAGRKLIEQSMGMTAKASDLEKANPTLKQNTYTGDPAEVAPMVPEDAKAAPYGASGTVIFAGFIAQEEYNAKLQGRQGLLKFDEMRKSDGTVRWSLQTLKLPIRAAEWRIQEASDSDRDKEIAEFVHYNLFERLNWTSVLREVMTYLDFGFFVAEKSYSDEVWQPKPVKQEQPKKPDPKPDPLTGIVPKVKADPPKYNTPQAKPMIVLHELANRKQTTIFRWEQSTGEPGLMQVTAQGTFDIPENRLMLLTHEREGNNYFGVSLLRSAYKHWYMKDAMYKISAVAAERQGAGVVKIKQLSKPSESERLKSIEAAKNLRANEEGYLEEPPGFDISFMDMFAHSTLNIAADIEHHDRQIMKNVGAAFMEMGATRQSGSTGGSRSASNDQSRVYELAVEAVANEIQEAFNAFVIRQLVDLNYSGVTKYPTLEHNKIGETDLTAYATAVSSLISASAITPDPDLEQSLRDRADLPDLPDDIRANYEDRERGQASTVPEYMPTTLPGAKPAPGAPGAKPTPGQKPAPAKPTVKASELAEDVKRLYSTIGDNLDAIQRAG